jgi:hypothetical protein
MSSPHGRNGDPCSSYRRPEDIVSRSSSVMSSKRRSRSASSGTYFVTGSSTSSIRPSSIAIPTSVDGNDLATEKDVWRSSRSAPSKYRSKTSRSSSTTTKASVPVSRRNSSNPAPPDSAGGEGPLSAPAGSGLTSLPAGIVRAGKRN